MKLSYRTQSYAQAIATIYNKPLDKPEWFKVVAAKDDEEAQILIFDYVGYPYNDPRDLIHALADMGNVTVRINSPGGDVFDGAAIYNALTSHKGIVTTRIEGLAASMASVIAMAGKKVQAYDNTMFMIHNSLTFAIGNQYELRDVADLLEKVDTTITDAYYKKTKKGKKEISEMMKATTWMTAKEAKEHGFIDAIVDGKSVKADFNLSIFANLPEYFHLEDSTEPDKRTIEKALRDVGFSQNKAKAFIARGLKADGDEPKEQVPSPIVSPQNYDAEIIAALRNNIQLIGGD
jgi:ATP-dependent Clp endopeptidase proteolytic subunit ClpP